MARGLCDAPSVRCQVCAMPGLCDASGSAMPRLYDGDSLCASVCTCVPRQNHRAGIFPRAAGAEIAGCIGMRLVTDCRTIETMCPARCAQCCRMSGTAVISHSALRHTGPTPNRQSETTPFAPNRAPVSVIDY